MPMPKNPPDLARLLPSGTASDRVQVQQTAFSYDALGRYVCNDWLEIEAQAQDGGFPFDAVVIGAGMFGGYCAEKLYRHSPGANLRVLVLEAGGFLFPTHIQNMPQRLGGSIGGAPKPPRRGGGRRGPRPGGGASLVATAGISRAGLMSWGGPAFFGGWCGS